MSELNKTFSMASVRHRMLATVSMTTLLCLAFVSAAEAGDSDDRPTVWIDLGGDLDRVGGSQEFYEPPFAILGQQHGLLPIGDLQALSRYSVGEQGSISFQPNNSTIEFLASIQYGRSSKQRYRHQENPITVVLKTITQHVNGPNPNGYVSQTSDYTVKTNESHAIVDFKVGKDIGVGLWKNSLRGKVEVGVRFAQFSTHTKMDLHGIPNPHLGNYGTFPIFGDHKYLNQYYQFYKAKPELGRNFTGWGPTVSWSGSLPVVESHDEDVGITLDLAANAAVLFGRQKVTINHQTTGDAYEFNGLGFVTGGPRYIHVNHYINTTKLERSRSVAVPNLGGSASLSFTLPNAKLSAGYRADFFFGAMDGGINTHKASDRNFYGPFATISIGL